MANFRLLSNGRLGLRMNKYWIAPVAIMISAHAASSQSYISGNFTELDGVDTWSVNGRHLQSESGGNILFDAGYSRDDEGAELWNLGSHLFVRDSNLLIGGFGGFSGNRWGGQWVLAGEAQYVFTSLSLNANLSYSESQGSELWSMSAGARYFITDNFSLGGSASVISASDMNGDGHKVDLDAEYRFQGAPLSLFIGYRQTDLRFREAEVAGIGFRWSFGAGSLIELERSGARLKRPVGHEVFHRNYSLE